MSKEFRSGLAEKETDMKHRNIKKKTTLSLFLICVTAMFMTGCGKDNEEVSELEIRANQTLCGIEYWYTSGMVFGEDIHMHITDEQIVYASYFPWEGMDDYSGEEMDCVTFENVAIEPEQWNEIEKAVMDIVPVLEQAENEKNSWLKKKLAEWGTKIFEVMDGGDTSGFILTWRDENGIETEVTYYTPGDRRFWTVLDLMKETVHPIGREIVWYDPPELVGFYVSTGGDIYSRQKNEFSYQCTVKDSDKGEWRFISYFSENGESASYSDTVNEDTWELIAEKCGELDLESLDYNRNSKAYATLYYSDGKQQSISPGKNDLKELQSFFEELVRQLRAD